MCSPFIILLVKDHKLEAHGYTHALYCGNSLMNLSEECKDHLALINKPTCCKYGLTKDLVYRQCIKYVFLLDTSVPTLGKTFVCLLSRLSN